VVQVQEMVQYRGSGTSLGVTFEQPDIEWCRCRNWYSGSGTSLGVTLVQPDIEGASLGVTLVQPDIEW
jgi:hypothetical protein